MTRTVKVTVEAADTVSPKARERAERQAQEAAVLELWQQQELTIREAAEELGLTYRQFLELLAARGIPVEQGPMDEKVLDTARQKLAGQR